MPGWAGGVEMTEASAGAGLTLMVAGGAPLGGAEEFWVGWVFVELAARCARQACLRSWRERRHLCTLFEGFLF